MSTKLPLSIGDTVGPYKLVRVIGRGAMAIVFEASRPEGKPVAVKVLLPEVGEQPTSLYPIDHCAYYAGWEGC